MARRDYGLRRRHGERTAPHFSLRRSAPRVRWSPRRPAPPPRSARRRRRKRRSTGCASISTRRAPSAARARRRRRTVGEPRMGRRGGARGVFARGVERRAQRIASDDRRGGRRSALEEGDVEAGLKRLEVWDERSRLGDVVGAWRVGRSAETRARRGTLSRRRVRPRRTRDGRERTSRPRKVAKVAFRAFR